jgi:predicted dehydrogenase
VTAALQEGPYGQCVYEASNDVNDNQVVNIQFSNGATVSFTLVAFTEAICDRQVRLHFTHGEIIGDMSTFTVSDFRARSRITKNPPLEGGGHGGGDLGLAKTFVEAVRNQDQTILGTNIAEVLQSHLTVFAAEQARRENKVIDYVAFEREVRAKYQPQQAH